MPAAAKGITISSLARSLYGNWITSRSEKTNNVPEFSEKPKEQKNHVVGISYKKDEKQFRVYEAIVDHIIDKMIKFKVIVRISASDDLPLLSDHIVKTTAAWRYHPLLPPAVSGDNGTMEL